MIQLRPSQNLCTQCVHNCGLIEPTIGLIICREAGREEVIYALDGLEEKIFIAKYRVKLPSETKIKKVIKKF